MNLFTVSSAYKAAVLLFCVISCLALRPLPWPTIHFLLTLTSSSSRMRVMNHNWLATKQCLHLQSVAEISRHSVLSGARIRQCGTSSGSRLKNTDQCL